MDLLKKCAIAVFFSVFCVLHAGNANASTENELDLQKNKRDKIAKRLNELGFVTNLSTMASPGLE